MWCGKRMREEEEVYIGEGEEECVHRDQHL